MAEGLARRRRGSARIARALLKAALFLFAGLALVLLALLVAAIGEGR